MFEAIGSLLKTTLDLFLKLNSAESRRRAFAKDVFGVYRALGDIRDALDRIDRTIARMTDTSSDESSWITRDEYPEYVVVSSWSSGGNVTIRTRSLGVHGNEELSPERTMPQHQLLPLVLGYEIRRFTAAVRQVARIMKAESWDLFQLQHQPDKLRALDIFNPEAAKTFTRAWFADGGFVEALMGLGLHQEVDGQILRLLDAPFDPRSEVHGYAIEPDETLFDLSKQGDIDAVRQRIATCRERVSEALEAMRTFIASNCKIEDML